MLRVLNADVATDIPYVSTRVAAEGSAEDKLAKVYPFGVTPAVAITWVRHLLVGLESCHAVGLLHRDVKPANLFLDRLDWALLGDFGQAWVLDANGLAPFGGTPATIAPEMWVTGQGGPRSDTYSVGITLYRLLTNRWPCEAANPHDVARAATTGVYPNLRDVAPHVSRRLAARIKRAMAIDPADRYQTPGGMHDVLVDHGVVVRSWQRIAAHSGHDRCWEERQQGRGSPLMVCVTRLDRGFEFTTSRQSASANRVRAYCGTVAGEAQLAVKLRNVFDNA